MKSYLVAGVSLALASVLGACPDEAAEFTDTKQTTDSGVDAGDASLSDVPDSGGVTPDASLQDAPDTAGSGDTGEAADALDTEVAADALDTLDGGTCCTAASDCAPGERCVVGATGPGFCVPEEPGLGRCYTNADCDSGTELWCEQAELPQCAPGAQPVEGWCTHVDPPLDCCVDAGTCEPNDVCVQGNCFPTPLVGACFDDSHCGQDEICVQELVVPCQTGNGDQSHPGSCVPKDQVPVCCGASWPCPAGMTCGLVPGAKEDGTCKPSGTADACWGDADCPTGLKCKGAFTCPCNALCGVIDTPGVCAASLDCCTTDWDCELGERCVGNGTGNGICKPVPAWGSCWDGNDCTPTQTCEGGSVCSCDADCDQEDTLGTCKGGDSGCCTGAQVCPAGFQCMPLSGIGWSTCVATPEPGRCWSNQDCPSGHTCEGAAFCPCSSDCDMSYEGPGVCKPPTGCTPLETAWVTEICDAKSLALWDGTKCVQTCPGCCGCEPFCDKTFESLDACQATCGCTLWDGSCDDAIPPAPWWALTAKGCEEITTCVCEGCPGAYPSKAACEACLK